MNTGNTVLNNLRQLQDRISRTCERIGRPVDEVRLLLATKTVSPEKIRIALETGHTLIGENKIQELRDKFEELLSLPHENHFIGHLQSNKVKDLLKYDVSCIHSIDNFSIAETINNRLLPSGKTMDILVQVNTSGETSKFGIAPGLAPSLVERLSTLSQLRVKGLMTIGLFGNIDEKTRQNFQLLRQTRDTINALSIPGVVLTELSMGMSGDLEIAIEEGATIIRVGTAIFGERQYPDSYYWNENTPGNITTE